MLKQNEGIIKLIKKRKKNFVSTCLVMETNKIAQKKKNIYFLAKTPKLNIY